MFLLLYFQNNFYLPQINWYETRLKKTVFSGNSFSSVKISFKKPFFILRKSVVKQGFSNFQKIISRVKNFKKYFFEKKAYFVTKLGTYCFSNSFELIP